MKYVLLSTLFIVSFLSAYAQDSDSAESAPVVKADFINDYVNDPGASKLVPSDYFNTDGSPYVTYEWLPATIKLDNNRQYENVMIRLNVYENKVHFLDADGKERMLPVKVKEVRFKDAGTTFSGAVFISGIAPNKNVFYRVLGDGSKVIALEKYNGKKMDVKVFNGESKYQFDIEKELYIMNKKTKRMFLERKSCEELTDVFDNDPKALEFAGKNKLKCNKKGDLLKLVDYYNSY